jgi:hypothetical protein
MGHFKAFSKLLVYKLLGVIYTLIMQIIVVKSEVLTAVAMRSIISWDVIPCSLVEIYHCSIKTPVESAEFALTSLFNPSCGNQATYISIL